MPVPWGATACEMPDSAKRALTIKQLRDLRFFLQRLCKTGLLRDEHNHCIDWYALNMYDICKHTIKPLIEHLEDHVRKSRKRYSWMELVAKGPQSPTTHVIHAWSGYFRDFMATVDTFAEDHRMCSHNSMWVCTFAISQFGENFGPSLSKTPACMSIKLCKNAVFLVDRLGESLKRIWCAAEVFMVEKEKKNFKVYTSIGQIGEVVKTGYLIEAVENYDIKECEASHDSDRRQILNFFAGGESQEHDGLKKDKEGNLQLTDGWCKHLDDVALDPDHPRRQNGQQEYVHEGKLFASHAEEFDHVNTHIKEYVKDSVVEAEKHGRARSSTQIWTQGTSRPQDRGITLAQWKTFGKRVNIWASSVGLTWRTLTVDEVAKKYLLNRMQTGRSYTEMINKINLPPRFMLDEPRQSSFAELLATVERFAEGKRLSDDTVIWCQLVCIRQHDVINEFAGWHHTTLPALLKDCDGLLSFLPNDRGQIVRCNRMLAWQIAFENGKQLYLGCPSGVVSCTDIFPDGGSVFGLFDPKLARIICEADWKQAGSADPKFGAVVTDRISKSRGGYAAYDARLCKVAAGPLLREAARTGGRPAREEIERLCSFHSVRVNSRSLSGPLGETAVHIAAAHGNVDVLTTLLNLKADPNSEDNICETPLHYAALAGQVNSVRVLLSYGAKAQSESAFAETPLYVAEQNVAAFMGVDTIAVVALLKGWQGIVTAH